MDLRKETQVVNSMVPEKLTRSGHVFGRAGLHVSCPYDRASLRPTNTLLSEGGIKKKCLSLFETWQLDNIYALLSILEI